MNGTNDDLTFDDMNDPYDNDLDDERSVEWPDLHTTIDLLKASRYDSISAALCYGLSGLTPDDLTVIQPVWDSLDVEFRRTLIRRLADLSETNFDLEYRQIGLLCLRDDDAEVRQSAIDLLWYDESLELMDYLIEMAQWDESTAVRAAAVGALGSFILAGELGELPANDMYRAQDTAISVYSNETEDVEVRRRALEAIANSSHEFVEEAIHEAYHSDDQLMRVSAVFAMGRTCDPRWKDIVLRELGSADPEMRYEAARASGELVLEDAVPYLIALTREKDREVKEAAIWSLGEIGGEKALTTLSELAEEAEEQGDDSLLEAVEDAIHSAALANMDLGFERDDEADRS